MTTKARIAITATDETRAAFASVTNQMAALNQRAQQVTGVFSGIGGGVAALLGGVGFAGLFKDITDGLDALNDLRDATGASIGNLSALEDIAGRAGTSFETVSGALIKFNGALQGAKAGSEAAQVFERLGLSVEELRAQDPAEAFQRVAVALQGFANDGDKARATQILFGRSLREVAPLLNDVAEAGRLNATVTEEQARQAEVFNKRLAETAKLAKDVGRSFVSDLLPRLNRFAAELKAGSEVFGGPGAALLTLGFSRNFEDAGRGVAFYTEKLRQLQERRAEIAAREIPGVAILDVEDEIAKVTRLQEYYRRVFSLTAPDNGQSDPRELARRLRGPAAVGLGTIGDDDGAGSQVAKRAQELAKGLADAINPAAQRALQAVQATDIVRIQQISGALDQLFAQRASGLGGGPELDEAIESLRTELEKLNPAARAAAASQAELNALLAATPSAQMAELARQAELLQAKLAGAVEPKLLQQLQEALELNRKRLEELGAAAAPVAQQLSEFVQQASRNIQDALGDSLSNVLEGKFKDIGDLWEGTVRRMIAQALAADLNKLLFGPGGGVGGGLVGQGLSFFGLAGARAFGGPVQAGRAYRVGERGVETFVPTQNGTVLPNGAGNSVYITQNLSVADGVGRGEFTAALNLLRQQIKAELMQDLFRTSRL